MSEYVVDTSIVIQELIEDHQTEHVRRLFSGLVSTDKLHIPEFCLVECVNVLWKRVRFQGLPTREAEILVAGLLSLPFSIAPMEEVLTRALHIGLAHKQAIYDSVYIALAENRKYPLITGEVRQEAVARAVGVTIKPITDF